MFKPIISINETVSLAVLLLLVVALIAGQATASSPYEAASAATIEQPQSPETTTAPLRTTIKAHLIGQPLTISIDPVAGFGKLRFIFK